MAAVTASFPSDDAGGHRDSLYNEAAWRFGLKRDAIEDISPCTPFQRDVIDCAAEDGRRGIGHVVYEIPNGVDIERLAAAWREVVRQTAVLRTCTFTSKTGGTFQVVLAESYFAWTYTTCFDNKESVVQDEAGAAMTGPRCNRYVVLEGRGEEKRMLIWTFSHALVDGALRERTLRRVLTAYDGREVQYSAHFGISGKFQAGRTEDAVRFWQQHFDGLSASVFPPLPSQVAVPRPDARLEHRISYPGPTQQMYSSIAVCRAGLAVLLSRLTLASEALFGIITERPHTLEEQEHPVDGPTRTLVPIRVLCAPDKPASDVIGAVTANDSAMRDFEQAGLSSIRGAGDEGSAACEFQTILLVTTGDAAQASTTGLYQIEEPDIFAPFTDRALLLHCHMTEDSVLLTARYDESVLDTRQMGRFLRQMGGLIQQFQSHGAALPSIGQLDLVTKEDRAEIANWNSTNLQAKDVTIHGVIAARAATVPEKTAVSAWNGEWTYAELENVSSRLAQHIKTLDFSQEQLVVPICFEKSKWVVAAVLGVLKAGRAYTLIDPASPRARIAQICRQTSATVAITSKLHRDTMGAVVDHCVVVDDDVFRSLSYDERWVQPTVSPRDLAYALFTSGSTGEPKGALIEHRGFASCALKFGSALGIDEDTRALQFASYAFGACLLEIITTLMHGGCVCIPSDEDRMNNVTDFIRSSEVNWALLTPSFIGTIEPDSVPGLRTLISVGEPMSSSLRDTWAPRVQLLNGYGQSESASICSVTEVNSLSPGPSNVCRAVGAHFWVVDPNEFSRLAPIGGIGELVVESPGIARGYITAPPQASAAFISTIPAWYPSRQLPDGVKFYRTGDLVSYRSDGSVVYLGRGDSQVKIRGQRVETGEVEAGLREQLSGNTVPVVEAVKRTGPSGGTLLVAFLIESSRGAEDTDTRILDNSAAQEIRMKLQQIVPQYAIPSYYILMNNLPQTVTGKIDRRRLRSIANELLDKLVHNVTVQPIVRLSSSVTSKESKLRELWFRGLGLDPDSDSGRASFFELGGNSIAAMRMVNTAKLAGIDLRVTDIFENPTLDGLIAAICPDSSGYSPIPATAYNGPVEQSFAQGRLWFLEQLKLEASWYLIPYGVRMRGTLRIDALTTALLALEQRHETLRTTFEEQDGVGMQVVHTSCIKPLRVIDMSGDQNGDYLDSLHQEQNTPFNLASEAGWRVSLIRLGEDDHILSIVMHHIISDGWSVDILRRELSQFYTAALRGHDPLAGVKPLPISYRDFAVWQKQEKQIAEHQRQLEYWTKQLADSSPAELLTDFPRPTTLSSQAGIVPVTIEGELYEKLLKFCKAHSATSFAVLLAAFRAAHHRLTGAEDATIGSPIANRNRLELEDMIGFFVNTQCMRIVIESSDTFESLVRQVRLTAAAAFEHQDVPFDRIVSALLPGSRDTSRNPLVQLVFAMHSQQDLGKFELEGLEGESLVNAVTTRFDLEFHLFQEAGKLNGHIIFAADLFKLETVQNLVNVFNMILHRGLDQPQAPIGVLPLTDGLADLRSMGLLEIERTEYPRESSIIDVFREQVVARPQALAVTDSSSRLTYAELDHRSDQLAYWLRRRNMAAETLVGVLASRSCQTIIALLGILKANLAYLPLDVKAPTARLETIITSLPGHRLVLSDATAPEIQLPGVELVQISETLEHLVTNGANGQAGTPVKPSARSLAHVIFTSGSTGKPKGVMVEHRGVVRLAKESNIIPRLPPAAKVAHLSNMAFDAATWEVYTALLNGGTLVCIDYMTSLDSKTLDAVFAREQVQAALLTPALLKQCLADSPATLGRLEVLVSGGDRLDGQDAIVAQALVQTGMFNAYGPTENAVISAIYHIAEDDSFVNGVPIGRAISNSGAFIMDPHQQLVPVGVMGELVVTGDGLARGYTDPTFNTDRFIQVTINGQLMRAYRTGDRARYRAGDGQIEFFGRMDQQVKIRGHRIEPAEVERAILEHDSIRDAVVVIRKQDGQGPEMIGFVVAQGDPSTKQDEAGSDSRQLASEIRERLKASVPSYMIPARIVVIDHMPVNANGKVDRKELTRRAQVIPKHEVAPAPIPIVPLDDIETMVCEEFAGVLGVAVGITDNFFELGGHSLMATKLAARVGRRLDAHVPVKDIFDHPVPGQLARKLKSNRSERNNVTNGIRTAGNASFQLLSLEDPESFIKREIYPRLENSHDIMDVYPATRLQKRYLDNPATGNPWPLMPFNIDFPPESDFARLTKACKSLVEYFDIFKTVFVEVGGELYQVVLKHFDIPIEIIQTTEDIDAATHTFLNRASQHPVTQGQPLLRISILKKRGSYLRVVLRMSHVFYDGMSLEPILHGLHALYDGDNIPAPPKFLEYMQHWANSRKDGYEFWRSILHDSTMTTMENVSANAGKQIPPIGTHLVSKAMDVPLQVGGITQATVFTTACALMLSKELGSNDILFGRLTSGRQGLPITCQDLVGPCANQIPTRVRIESGVSPKDLLVEVQDQYVNSIPFETLGFDEIRDNCTSWGKSITNYSCCVAYQSFDANPESQIQGHRVQMGVLPQDDNVVAQGAIHDIVIIGDVDPKGSSLNIIIFASRLIWNEERKVHNMLEDLCGRIQTLNSALRDPHSELASQHITLDSPIETLEKAINGSVGDVDSSESLETIRNGFNRDASSLERIYVLGVGNLGKYVAHALRKRHPRLPITLLFHRADLEWEWDAAGRAITLMTDDISDKRTGFDVEFLLDSTGQKAPIKHLIVATKTYMTAPAIDLVKGRLGKDSSILFLQNGMGTVDEVSASIFSDPKSRPSYWAGVCSCGVYSTSQFTIVYAGRGSMVLGPVREASEESLKCSSISQSSQDFMIQRLLEAPGLEATITTPDQIREAQLRKLVVNAVINPLTAVFQCDNNELFSQPSRLVLARTLVEEAGDIVRTILPRASHKPENTRFSNKKLLASVRMVAEATGKCKSSMLQDIQAGRRTEIDHINGYLALQGRRHGLACVNNDRLIDMVKQRRVIVDEDIRSLFDMPSHCGQSLQPDSDVAPSVSLLDAKYEGPDASHRPLVTVSLTS
ncbi:hypothetical protein ONZ43_g606 [Nemania bipapillata]|uniref:Uncharacterized protein n=1 Tax=Nemania bipapillata TaxID=110536 RepID=A0ACC2J7T0_9PEZI|nr:hypothetical protein ONZ43_g606 [Nemania bipapillata]